ncbi:MAG: hypothetical protein HN368_10780 [Spirochaetales bacterium]|jgi:hypothetical protein|nr:hypothetical protein [Spirochaetales bacterium]
MNRVLTTALILVLAGGLVGAFAEGQSEDPSTRFGPGGRSNEFPELEEIILTGQVYFEGLDFPVLKTAEKEYGLMVPRFYTYDIDIKDGKTITVEGLLGPEEMPRGRFSESDEFESHVMVTKAIIDGEEFEIDSRYGSMMSRDFDPKSTRRGGPMGGRSHMSTPRGGRG